MRFIPVIDHPDAASFAFATLRFSPTNLAQAAGSRDEIPCLRVNNKSALECAQEIQNLGNL